MVAHERIGATVADEEHAELLEEEIGAPLLTIERKPFANDGGVVEFGTTSTARVGTPSRSRWTIPELPGAATGSGVAPVGDRRLEQRTTDGAQPRGAPTDASSPAAPAPTAPRPRAPAPSAAFPIPPERRASETSPRAREEPPPERPSSRVSRSGSSASRRVAERARP
ncbi:UTRA domain-containing protein [Brachybacterium paraconglomeratum]|uniref:UTRA domain-containing protein n=1 Tax=Brachybacterium paraconglomeratum TaxID=173362 RepID=UPI003FD581DD